MERLELSWGSPPPPQDGVSARSTTSAHQELNWPHNLRGGLGDLNYSITLITRNLLILHSAQRPKCPTIPLPLYVYCTANVSQKRKPRRMFSLNNASNSLTSSPHIGQGHRRNLRRTSFYSSRR